MGIACIILGIVLEGLMLVVGAEISQLSQELGQPDPLSGTSNLLAIVLLLGIPIVGIFLIYHGWKLQSTKG